MLEINDPLPLSKHENGVVTSTGTLLSFSPSTVAGNIPTVPVRLQFKHPNAIIILPSIDETQMPCLSHTSQ